MSYVSEEIQLKVLVPYANNSMEEFLTGFFCLESFVEHFLLPAHLSTQYGFWSGAFHLRVTQLELYDSTRRSRGAPGTGLIQM